MMPYAAYILLLLCFSAFFSGSEIAFSSINRVRLENMMEDGNPRAKIAFHIYSNFEKALSTILIGNNLVNIGASSLATFMAITLVGERAVPYAALVMTLLILTFGETSPKIFASKNSLNFALAAARPLQLLMILFAPILFVILPIVGLVGRRFSGDVIDEEMQSEAVEEELLDLLDTVENEGVIDENRRNIMNSALSFAERSVSEALTARVDMYAIDLDDERDAIIAQILDSPFSRIPFYEKSVDNIMGILIVNRFYRRIIDNPDLDIREILMEPIYLYRTTKMPAALNQLRKSQIHMGIVTDDYGGNMGIITIEDIMETIVGEIWDENDVVYNEIRQVDENTYELDGDLSISEFLELVDWDEDEFEFESDTLGGWCIEMKEGFPSPGDTFQYENITVTVLAMDNLRVDRLKVSIDRMHDRKKDNN